METQPKKYLTRKEAAAYLSNHGVPVAAGTLQKLASEGGGPRYKVVGRNALYRPADLDAWVDEVPTKESAPPKKSPPAKGSET